MAIVDTNVVSYGITGSPLAFTYAQLLADYKAHVSFMTVAELHYGAEKRRWSQRRRIELEILLLKYSVVPYSNGMATLYASVLANRERAGRPMDVADAWIATVAIFHDAPLATNDSDFRNTPGLRLITADEGEVRAMPRFRAGARLTRPLDASCSCGL